MPPPPLLPSPVNAPISRPLRTLHREFIKSNFRGQTWLLTSRPCHLNLHLPSELWSMTTPNLSHRKSSHTHGLQYEVYLNNSRKRQKTSFVLNICPRPGCIQILVSRLVHYRQHRRGLIGTGLHTGLRQVAAFFYDSAPGLKAYDSDLRQSFDRLQLSQLGRAVLLYAQRLMIGRADCSRFQRSARHVKGSKIKN